MFSTTCSLARFQSFNKINFDEHWPLFIISLNFKKALALMICLIYYLCSIMMSHVPHIKYELKVFRNHIIIIRAHHWLHVAYYYQKEEGHFCLAPSVDRYLVQINSARPPLSTTMTPGRPLPLYLPNFLIDAKWGRIFVELLEYFIFKRGNRMKWLNANCNTLRFCHSLFALYHIFIYLGDV